jgi:hypothetical protein
MSVRERGARKEKNVEVDDLLFGNILYVFLTTIALGICFRVIILYCERITASVVASGDLCEWVAPGVRVDESGSEALGSVVGASGSACSPCSCD